MPVCDARTQNGDRAFLHMVIENLFVSGFRSLIHIVLLRCYLRNIGYYRATKFRFKIIRAERLTRMRAPQAARFPRFRGTGERGAVAGRSVGTRHLPRSNVGLWHEEMID